MFAHVFHFAVQAMQVISGKINSNDEAILSTSSIVGSTSSSSPTKDIIRRRSAPSAILSDIAFFIALVETKIISTDSNINSSNPFGT